MSDEPRNRSMVKNAAGDALERLSIIAAEFSAFVAKHGRTSESDARIK